MDSREIFEVYRHALDLQQAGRTHEAEAACRRLLDEARGNDQALFVAGTLLLQAGRLEEGIARLREALAIDDRIAERHVNLGHALSQLGRHDEAAQAYTRALEIDPGAAAVQDRLVSALASQAATAGLDLVLRSLDELGRQRPEIAERLPAAAVSAIAIRCRRQIPDATELATACAGTRFEASQLLKRVFRGVHWRHARSVGDAAAAAFGPADLAEFLEDPGTDFDLRSTFVGGCLGYSLENPRSWNEAVFEQLIAPAAALLLERGSIGRAVELNVWTEFSFAQQPHTEDQALRCHQRLSPGFVAAGERLAASWPPAPALGSARRPTIVFLTDMMVNGSSPDRVVLQCAAGISQLPGARHRAVIVSFSEISSSFRARIDAKFVRCVSISELRGRATPADDYVERLARLRKELAALDAAIVVYYNCTEGFLGLAPALRLAPHQLFFSMSYHYCDNPHIDALLAVGTTGEQQRVYRGRSWQIVQLVIPNEETPAQQRDSIARAKPLRQALLARHKVLLATIGRPQKLNNEAFLQALAAILRARPEAAFLWFGDVELDSLRQRLEALGIVERCLFQGFQPVAVYAHVIDIHLDSFPFPGGLTVFETMRAGVASLFYESQEALETGVPAHIFPILRGSVGTRKQQETMRRIFTHKSSGEGLALMAKTPEEYVAGALRLIDDEKFRRAVGGAGQQFMREFKEDGLAPARSLVEACERIIAEPRGAA